MLSESNELLYAGRYTAKERRAFSYINLEGRISNWEEWNGWVM